MTDELDGKTQVRVSYSTLNKHRLCPQKWYYAHELRLAPSGEATAVEMNFGSWWHALRAAESLDRGRVRGSIQHTPRSVSTTDDGPTLPGSEVTVMRLLEESGVWWRGLSDSVKEKWTERLGEPMPQRLQNLFDRWCEQWSKERAQEVPLATEMWWQRRLPVNSDEYDFVLGGFIDEVYLDEKRKIIVVRDHKSNRALAPSKAVDDMMDSQLQLYAWGAAPVIQSWNAGSLEATGFDRARMVAPKTPSLTKSGTLSKTVTDYDLHTYLAWVGEGVPYPGLKKDGSKAGVYLPEESVIARLSDPAATSAWFQRTLVPLNRNLMRLHVRSAIQSAQDVQRTKLSITERGEGQRNLTASCRFCDFADLCRAQMLGGPDGEYDYAQYGLVEREPRERL